MDFVEHQIEHAKRAGFFDDLPGKGKPIADLHEERDPGWWGKEYLRRERALERLRDLQKEIAKAKAASWRGNDHEALRAELRGFNERLVAVNHEVDVADRAELIDVEAELALWRAQRRKRLWGV
jgi:hypothetical protein